MKIEKISLITEVVALLTTMGNDEMIGQPKRGSAAKLAKRLSSALCENDENEIQRLLKYALPFLYSAEENGYDARDEKHPSACDYVAPYGRGA